MLKVPSAAVPPSSRVPQRAYLEGERVLVVGAGDSGCDLAVDAAQAGFQTHVSVRHGLMFQPKTLFGGRARSCRCSAACRSACRSP